MRTKIILLSLFLTGPLLVGAQQTLTLHYMQSIPQRTMNNPALIPDSRFHMSFPGLGSVNINYRNSIALKDVFMRNGDSLLLDLPTIAEKLGDNNLLGLDVNEELFSLGFRFGKNYLAYNASLNVPFRMSLPPDLLTFMVKGNSAFLGEEAEIGGLGLDLSVYMENSLGYSRQITDGLRVGLRGKMILGLANISTNDVSISIFTDPDDYTITANSRIQLNASLPFIADSIPLGAIDSLNIEIPDLDREFIINSLRSSLNRGYAFDFGINYKLSERWSFNAAILDIGSITWDKNVRVITSEQSSFTFEGLDIYQMFSDSADFGEKADELLDSLIGMFDPVISGGSFTQTLIPKFYLGASYSLTPGTVFGALVRAEYFDKKLYPTYTFSLTKRLTRLLTLAGSYTVRENSYANFGAGFSLNLIGMQFYMVTDNASNFLYWDKSLNMNLRLGLNMTIGRKVRQNKPLLDT